MDYIFIDCPPSLGLLTLNALVAASEVLIPIQCEYYALEGLAQLLNTIDLVKAHLNPDLTVGTVLLTMYDSRTRLADQVADEVRKHFGDRVLGAVIPRNVRVSEAPGFGQTVITYDPGSRGAMGYLQAAREFAERGARRAGAPVTAKRRGGLGRGLGALIPTSGGAAEVASAPTTSAPIAVRPTDTGYERRRPPADSIRPSRSVPVDATVGDSRPDWLAPGPFDSRRRRRPAAGARRAVRRDRRSAQIAANAKQPRRSSTRTRWPS